jgi:hypothetical protein
MPKAVVAEVRSTRRIVRFKLAGAGFRRICTSVLRGADISGPGPIAGIVIRILRTNDCTAEQAKTEGGASVAVATVVPTITTISTVITTIPTAVTATIAAAVTTIAAACILASTAMEAASTAMEAASTAMEAAATTVEAASAAVEAASAMPPAAAMTPATMELRVGRAHDKSH